jgi:hypothetical protein
MSLSVPLFSVLLKCVSTLRLTQIVIVITENVHLNRIIIYSNIFHKKHKIRHNIFKSLLHMILYSTSTATSNVIFSENWVCRAY